MTTNRSIRAINLSTALLLLGGTVGCDVVPGDDPATTTADTTSIADKLSPDARKMALDNQAQGQRDGLQLAWRVWFAPDAYGEVYEGAGAEPERTTHFVSRGNGPLVKETDLQPRQEERLDAYIARTRPGLTPMRFDLASGAASADALDVLLFKPAPAAASAGDATTVTSAIMNEFCNIADINARCAANRGWAGPVTPAFLVGEPWAIPDVVSFQSDPRVGTSFNTAVCADRGAATMTIFKGGAIETVRQVPQGFADQSNIRVGYREDRFCKTYFLGSCIDFHYKIDFAQTAFMQQVSVTGAGANAHVCGKVKNNSDKTQDESCRSRNNCPVETF